MKEVDIIPDDPKSIECIKQLEQVILLRLCITDSLYSIIMLHSSFTVSFLIGHSFFVSMKLESTTSHIT